MTLVVLYCGGMSMMVRDIKKEEMQMCTRKESSECIPSEGYH
jgi:hypothetical protein